jgi:uncharacterized protein
MFTDKLQEQPETIRNFIHKVVDQLKPQQVILFGSRARQENRPTSDFDIACKFENKDADQWTLFNVAMIDDLTTLWPIDFVDYSDLTEAYKKNIDQEGIVLYG